MAPRPTDDSRPDRSTLKTMVTFVDPEVARRVKRAAVDNDATVQIVFERAIMEFLERYDAHDKRTLSALKDAAGKRVSTGPKPAQVAKPA